MRGGKTTKGEGKEDRGGEGRRGAGVRIAGTGRREGSGRERRDRGQGKGLSPPPKVNFLVTSLSQGNC
jgi:hypothetical protein